MFKTGDTVEFQETEGVRTRRRVVKVVKTGNNTTVGSDLFKPGLLVQFENVQVTNVVRRSV